MTNQQQLPNEPGKPGLFQLDIERPDANALYRFISEQLARQITLTREYWQDEKSVFEFGKPLMLDIQFWSEPGYYINTLIQVSFAYVKVSAKNGLDAAPHEITCSTQFKYPFDTEHTFVAVNRTGRVTDLAMDITYSLAFIIQKVGDLLLSEAITE